MKETQIVKKYKNIEFLAQILDGKFAIITDDNRSEKEGRNDDFWSSDNDEYVYTLFQVLKEVDRRGGFEHLKNHEEDVDVEKIYI